MPDTDDDEEQETRKEHPVLAAYGLQLPLECINPKDNTVDLKVERIAIQLSSHEPRTKLFEKTGANIKIVGIVCIEYYVSGDEFVCVSNRGGHIDAGGDTSAILPPRVRFKDKMYLDVLPPGRGGMEDKRYWVVIPNRSGTNLLMRHAPELKGQDLYAGTKKITSVKDGQEYYPATFERVNGRIYCPLGYMTDIISKNESERQLVMCPDGIRRMGYMVPAADAHRLYKNMEIWTRDVRYGISTSTFEFVGMSRAIKWSLCATLIVFYSDQT